jgi:hypothetical protein
VDGERSSDVQHDALSEALRLGLAERGPDVCRTEWGKALGEGLYELRVRHTAKEIAAMFGGAPPGAKAGERVLLRVFFHAYGERVVLLLGDYDKGKDTSERRQKREIATARKRLEDFKAQTLPDEPLAQRSNGPTCASSSAGLGTGASERSPAVTLYGSRSATRSIVG